MCFSVTDSSDHRAELCDKLRLFQEVCRYRDRFQAKPNWEMPDGIYVPWTSQSCA
jgi:hypothetical protein